MKFILCVCVVLLVLLGALVLYMASQNQKIRGKKLPAKSAVPIGLCSLLAAILCLAHISGPAAFIFIFMTLVMMVWALLPFPFAISYARKQTRAGEGEK